MKYKAIIFDLDGVICHTDRYHYQAWKKIADELEIAFDESVNNRLRGVSRRQSLEIILENYDGELSQTEKDLLLDEKNVYYRELLHTMSPADLSPEVKDTLAKCREKGLKLAIGSSSKNAGFILGRLGLDDYFDAVSDGNTISHSKPNPEVFQKASQMLGLRPKECLVVEDAEAGIAAAFAGGFDSAGIGDASNCLSATYHLETFADIVAILEN